MMQPHLCIIDATSDKFTDGGMQRQGWDGYGAPRVTIVTPTFNRYKLISETIDSIISQSYVNFEYFIIDDGSHDETKSLVESIKDPRVTYFWHENRGEAATTNRGWAMARGEYFAVLSSDDLVQPLWLERMIKFMDEHPDVLVAYPDFQIIDRESNFIRQIFTPDYDRNSMISSFHPFPGVGAIIRRSKLLDVLALRNPDYRYAPDLDCWLRLSLRGSFARVPENLAAWRSHDGSITVAERELARASEMITIARKFFSLPDLPREVAQLAPFALSQAYAAARWVLQDTHPLRAALYLRRSHAIAPAQHDSVLPGLKRYPRPGRREILRLLRNSFRHRAYLAAKALGSRSPPPLRRLGVRVLLRSGLITPVSTPPALQSHAAQSGKSIASGPVDPQDPFPASAACAASSIAVAQERFDAMLPQLREDMAALSDTVSPLTPTKFLFDTLRPRMTMMACTARGSITAAILERLPTRIEHMLVVPWLGTIGGSEVVTARLVEALRRHYGDEGLCVVAPDIGYRGTGVSSYLGVPFVGFSDVDASLDETARHEIFDRIMIQRRPKVVHCINSSVGWRALRERASAYAHDSALFANIYSDIRLEDGAPGASYYYDFLPHCINDLTAVMVDNQAIMRKATTAFGLGPALRDKLYVVRTPVLGIHGSDPRQDLRRFHRATDRRSLWLSRLAKEKRLDVLSALAQRCPERSFVVYGSNNGGPVDLGALTSLPNVSIAGDFPTLDAIPYDSFDSYVFTTSGEGMPIALLEMAAKGLPLVAPCVGGIGELVNDDTGWLVSRPDAVGEYADALAQIEADPDEARRRVSAAQAVLLRDHTRDAFDRAIGAVPHYLGGYA